MKSFFNSAFALFLFFNVSAQEGTLSYSATAQAIQNDSLQPPELFQFQSQIYQLPANRDSIDWLVPQMIERSEKYGEYLPRIYMLQQICTWYDNIYKDNDATLSYIDRLLETCEDAGDSVDYYWLTNSMSFRMFVLEQGGKEDEAVLVAKKIADRLEGEEQVRPRSYGYRQLCVFYERVRDFENANYFCRLGIRHNEEHNAIHDNNSFYETIALVHERTDRQIDSIIYYRKNGLRYALAEGNEQSLRVKYSNLADDFSHLGKRDSAEKYFSLSSEYFSKYPYLQGEITMLLKYAFHLNKKGEAKKAILIADTLLPLLDSSESKSWITLWRVKSLSMSFLGKGDSAEHFSELSDSVTLHRFNEERVAAEEEMATKYETEKKEAAITLLQSEKKSANFQKGLYLSLAVLLLLSGGFLFWKRKKDQQLAEVKRQQLVEEKKQAEGRVRQLKNDLERSIAQALDHQNRNIELQDLVEELNTQVENAEVQSKTRIIRNRMSEYAQEETLDDIEYRAREVFPRLYSMLYTRLSGRSKVELVYCVMLVMNYSNEDISRILQKSDKAVKSLRYRIRKKLELEEGKDLSQFLKNHTEWGDESN